MPTTPVSLLLTDEHFPDQSTFGLRKLGHDVVRVRDRCANKAGDSHSDAEVLAMAISEGRAVVTENCSDFQALIKKTKTHNGVIGSKQFDDYRRQAKEIDHAIRCELKKNGSLDGVYIKIPYEEIDDSRPVPLRGRS